MFFLVLGHYVAHVSFWLLSDVDLLCLTGNVQTAWAFLRSRAIQSMRPPCIHAAYFHSRWYRCHVKLIRFFEHEKINKIKSINLHDIVELVMCIGLVTSEQDRVPRRPLLVLVPAHEYQVQQIVVLTQRTLAVPDWQHQLPDVHRLTDARHTRANVWQFSIRKRQNIVSVLVSSNTS